MCSVMILLKGLGLSATIKAHFIFIGDSGNLAFSDYSCK